MNHPALRGHRNPLPIRGCPVAVFHPVLAAAWHRLKSGDERLQIRREIDLVAPGQFPGQGRGAGQATQAIGWHAPRAQCAAPMVAAATRIVEVLVVSARSVR